MSSHRGGFNPGIYFPTNQFGKPARTGIRSDNPESFIIF
jgi:hypothetical protein